MGLLAVEDVALGKPFMRGDTLPGLTVESLRESPVADIGDVDVAMVVFVDGSEYGVKRVFEREGKIGPRLEFSDGERLPLPDNDELPVENTGCSRF